MLGTTYACVGGMSNRARLVLAVAAMGLVAGCGATPLPAATSPSPATGHVYVATIADNGTTLSVRVGDELKVQLNSTYWTIQGAGNTAVLRAVQPAVVSPDSSGCVPGGGCGTVTMVFEVAGAGSTDVTASRQSCGEAMRCTGGDGSFRVSVVSTP